MTNDMPTLIGKILLGIEFDKYTKCVLNFSDGISLEIEQKSQEGELELSLKKKSIADQVIEEHGYYWIRIAGFGSVGVIDLGYWNGHNFTIIRGLGGNNTKTDTLALEDVSVIGGIPDGKITHRIP